MLYIRNAGAADLPRIMEIYRYAQEQMIRSGNPTQWGRTYPGEALIRSDMQGGTCRVICGEEGIHGVFALLEGADPTYRRIEDGHWRNDEPYITIHRMAGDGQVHGLFACAAEYCRGLCRNIRVDTHADNQIMQKCIEKQGFLRCGIIRLRDGSLRIAYQWTAGSDGANGNEARP